MEKHNDPGLQASQKVQGVWERRTGDRRLGQNQLFGSFRVNPVVRLVNRQSDPTDEALAVIASILHKPDKPAETRIESPADPPVASAEMSGSEAIPSTAAVSAEVPEPPSTSPDLEIYIKHGPGPLDAIRFKWAARPAGDGTYFVDETIGDSPRVTTSGPMSKEQAVRFVDERERDAQRRFDALKHEMTGQETAAASRG